MLVSIGFVFVMFFWNSPMAFSAFALLSYSFPSDQLASSSSLICMPVSTDAAF
jgi:hypothetical protein